MMGRPVSRYLDDGETLSVNRVAVNDKLPKAIIQNACSKLYSQCCKWAKDKGYTSVITYTLASENGSSVRSANFIHEHTNKGRSWNCKSRPRKDNRKNGQPINREPKNRWRKSL